MSKNPVPNDPTKHNSETGRWNDLTKAYKADPSINFYVKMRRNHPKALIEIATSRSMDWLCTNQKYLESVNIAPEIVAGCLDADPTDISELSLLLMENLIKRQELEETGRAHVQSVDGIISDSLINYLISMMLDALDWNDELFIPRDLIVLIKHQFSADISFEIKKQEVADKRMFAIFHAARTRAMGQKCSIRDIAKVMKVSPSTVSRWFPEKSFDEEVERLRPLYDENGESEMDRWGKEYAAQKKKKSQKRK